MKRLLILSLLGIGFLGQAFAQDWSDYIVPGVAAAGTAAAGLGAWSCRSYRAQLDVARAQLAEANKKISELEGAHGVFGQTIMNLNSKIQDIGIALTKPEGAKILSEGMMSREGVDFPRVRLLDVWNDNKAVLNKIVIDAMQVNRMPLPPLEQ